MEVVMLKSNLLSVQPDEQKRDLWTPLPDQGWKPCIRSSITRGNTLR
uniref:Uncharacterized protein n=1 Tax=Aegilops tauschii subsp. strangulata TaxID=200361 RepID=A0A453KY14_AEGTS